MLRLYAIEKMVMTHSNVSMIDKRTGKPVRIGEEGEQYVVVHPHPPKDEVATGTPVPFRQYFTDTGLSTGSNDMQVDGATTETQFYIKASQDKDIYIGRVSVVIADASATLNKFGNITALTNGVEFAWVSQDLGTTVIHEAMKTNFDFVRLGGGSPAFGDTAGAFRASNVSGNSEAYIPQIDFSEIFGMPWGVRLRKGTEDRLCFVVKDDTRGVDLFDAIGFGIEF